MFNKELFIKKAQKINISKPFWLGIAGTLAYLIPFVLLQENSYIYFLDNLDSEYVYRSVLKQAGKIYSFENGELIPQIMNGLPRVLLPTGINFYMLLIWFFDNILIAYIINAILVHLLAYIGMYLLLSRISRQSSSEFLIACVSLCFSILPFQTNFGLSLAGIPLVLYAFIGLIKDQQRVVGILILFLFPFYAVSLYIVPFIAPVLFAIYCYKFKSLSNYWVPLLGIAALSVGLFITDYSLIKEMIFDKQFVVHRQEFNGEKLYPPFFDGGIPLLFSTVFHLTNMPEASLQIGVWIAFFALAIRAKGKISLKTLSLLLVILAISFLYAFYFTSEFHSVKPESSILNSFHFFRFSNLLPALWYILFFLILAEMKGRFEGFYKPFVFLQILVVLAGQFQVQMVIKKVLGYTRNTEKEITYRQFFSPKLFTSIKKFIGKEPSSYRVLSLGLYPSVALHNGFFTLDNYQNIYLLDYKHQFKKVIDGELEKSEKYNRYFNYWGHFCMIFSHELPEGRKQLLITKEKSSFYKVKNLLINTAAAKSIGAKYIFSAVEIENATALDLKLLRIFEEENSIYKIFLYKFK